MQKKTHKLKLAIYSVLASVLSLSLIVILELQRDSINLV